MPSEIHRIHYYAGSVWAAKDHYPKCFAICGDNFPYLLSQGRPHFMTDKLGDVNCKECLNAINKMASV